MQLQSSEEEEVPFNLREVRDAAEEQATIRALMHVDGNVSKAAGLLGISRPTLYDLMNKYNIKQ
jgi:two-component system NtrC family response regulator